jgi:LuxR family maltose regulon positive regulatory protein
LQLTRAEVTALEARTEGWVAGLQLAALSLRGRQDVAGFIAAFTGSHRFIVDYLAEEVIGHQPAELQSFLLQTSILDRMCSSLCDAVTGRTDSHLLLERLQQQNLFIILLDDERKWQRYHHLFPDLLRTHLQQPSSPLATLFPKQPIWDIQALHRRAATWFAAAGLLEEAIHHALAAQEFAWAGNLILQAAEAKLTRGEVALLFLWLEALPEVWVHTELQLQLLQVALLFLSNQFAAVQARLPAVEYAWQLAQRDPTATQGLFSHQEIPGLIAGLQAEIALFRDNFPRAVALSQQALAQLGRDILGLRSVIGNHFALHYWVRQAGAQVTPPQAGFGAAGDHQHDPADLIVLSQQAELKRIQGQYRQAILLFQRLLHLATEAAQPDQWLTTGLAHGMLSYLLYEANELVAAEAHAQQAIKLGQQGAGVGALFASYTGLSKVLLAQGNFAAVAETVAAMKQLAQSLDSTIFLRLATLLQMDLALAQGDLRMVAHWQQASGMRIDDAFDRSSALVYSRFARILVALGEVDAALTLLARLLEVFEATQWIEGMIKTFAVQAIAFRANHHRKPALSSLQRALTLAEPERYIRTFIDLGTSMHWLLLDFRDGLTCQPADEQQRRLLAYVDQLIGEFAPLPQTANSLLHPAHPPTPTPGALRVPQPLIEPLTARELQVLQLMAAGHSNREMAQLLVVSLGTVKKHLNNIFGKLSTTSRTQAIARARELQLL